MGKRKPDQRQPRVTIEGEVLRQIRQHARSNSKTEVCGVLIGEETGNGMNITARIPGLNAAQAGTYVTFTQDTWEHIYKIKDKDFPDDRIVGWYHSHPGFGVFLSDHDTFIHKNFFSSPQQVAWVYDPHSDEEGCFGWDGERLKRLARIDLVDARGGELAGGSDRSDRAHATADDSDGDDIPKRPPSPRKDFDEFDDGGGDEISRLTNIVYAVFSYLAVLAIGTILGWYLFHRTVYLAVDPYTGQVIGILKELPPQNSPPPDSSPSKQVQPNPSK